MVILLQFSSCTQDEAEVIFTVEMRLIQTFVETKLINDIAVELKNYASSAGYNVNVIGDQYFKDMAWGGLHETDVFKNSYSLSEKQRINNRYNAELTNSNVGNVSPVGSQLCE